LKEKEVYLEDENLGGLFLESKVDIIDRDEEVAYRVYIDNDVTVPSAYREIINLLLSAKEKDIIYVDINTYGGDLYSTIAIVNAIRDSEAKTVADVTHASSAGSFIALACDVCNPLPHGDFYLHEIQSHTGGSVSTQLNEVLHLKEKQKTFFRDVYKGFLTDEEINDLLDGKSKEGMYIDAEEAKVRLERREKLRQESTSEDVTYGEVSQDNSKITLLKDDEAYYLLEDFLKAKTLTNETVSQIKDDKLNIEDISLDDLLRIEFYLTFCNRTLTQYEEEILERLDFVLSESEDELGRIKC
jgi:ATP-dependent protease ClpP protease subunit